MGQLTGEIKELKFTAYYHVFRAFSFRVSVKEIVMKVVFIFSDGMVPLR